MSLLPQKYDDRHCFAPCPEGQPCHCRDAVRESSMIERLAVPQKIEGEDFPLGQACDRHDPDCEACQ